MAKEYSKNEKYVIKWFKDNGFEIKKIKSYISKTKFEIVKNGEKQLFELPFGIQDIKKYMGIFKKDYEIKQEIKDMKMKLKK